MLLESLSEEQKTQKKEKTKKKGKSNLAKLIEDSSKKEKSKEKQTDSEIRSSKKVE